MKRFYKEGFITTLIGILIIAFAGLMIYQGKSSAGEMGGWLTTGILFLRSKDSLIGLPKKDSE